MQYSESALNPPTNIPVMQSILGAVTNPSTPHPHCIGDSSSYSPPTSHASGVLPYHYDHRLNSHYFLNQDDQGSSTVDFAMPNHSTKSSTYTNQDAINKSMNSHPPFNQHSQQQEANTAAALAAAACFGAMLSQPVAAAAAASHAAASVTKPTAGVIGDISVSLPQTSGGGSGGHTITAAAAANNVGIVLPSPSPVGYGAPAPPPQPQPSPAPPPPQPASAAVAAAAAAAAAAAVVSSAGPSAAVAAMSAAHLATSSFSRAHSGPHVSCTSTIPALCASTSRYLATLNPPVSVESLDHLQHRQLYSPSDSFSLHMTCPSSSASQQQQQICSVSSALSSSAATAVYTATMTTAVAAAAMAAAAAVEEHNQKKNAAAAAMAAFNESAALAHEVQSISRMTEHVSLPSDSLSPTNHITTSHSGISTLCLNAEMPDNQYNPRRRLSSTTASRRKQQQVPRFSSFDMDEDESYGEESNSGDEEEYEIEVTTADSLVVPRISRSSTPDRNFGRNPPLFHFLRKRSYSFSHLESYSTTESQPHLSSQSSKTSNIISRFRKRALLSKRPKLENVDRGVNPSRHRIYRRCQNRLQQDLDEESEVDEEERFCYTTEETNFFSPSSVVTPPSFRERICDLRRENAKLRGRLKRIVREHKFLQDENRSLMEQNRRLKKCVPNMISSSKCSNPQLSSRQWVIQSLKTGSQSSVSVSAAKRRKSANRSSFGQMQ